MRSLLSFTLIAAGIAQGSPAPPKMTANFDDIKIIPGANLLNTIDVYKGLKFIGWLVNDGTLALAGVSPSTKPNALNHAITTDNLDDDFGFNLHGTNAKSFDLFSMDLGCVLDLENDAGAVASPCTLLIQGYRDRLSQHTVAEKTVTYNAHNPKDNPLFKNLFRAKFSKEFQGLQKVRIRQIESLGGPATNSVVLDTVVYAFNH